LLISMINVLNKLWLAFKKLVRGLTKNILQRNPEIEYKVSTISERIDDMLYKISSKNYEYMNGFPYPRKVNLLRSKLCTESDFHQRWFRHWRKLLGYKSTQLHRKIWEYATIAQALYERNMLEPGKKGLGFGVGTEPLPSLFASRHCHVLATDIGPDTEGGKLWVQSKQHLFCTGDLIKNNLFDAASCRKYVSYQQVDMRNIPESLRDFDFTWSSCAFEHLGSIQNGINFIVNQMSCLKEGGWAVHTTEFNLTSNERTLEGKDLVFFRRSDIEHLIELLNQKGYFVEELDTSVGLTKSDYFVDVPPYSHSPHLKLRMGNYVITSIILIIRK